MAMANVDQDIANNQASNDAVQINIGSLQLGRDNRLQEFSSLIRSFLALQQNQDPPSQPDLSSTDEVEDFLKDLAEPQAQPARLYPGPKVPGRTLFDVFTRPSETNFWVECFPTLQLFDHVVRESLHHYARDFRAPVLESLSLQQQLSLGSWVESSKIRLLCIEGCLRPGAFDWTTGLALETIGATQDAIANLDDSNFAILYHLCSPKVAEANRTPELVTQDLIMQLVTGFCGNFTQPLCQKHSITQSRFGRVSNSLQALWGLFEDCLIVANPKSLVMVLDNVDSLREEAEQAGRLDVLNLFLDNVNALARHKSILVKVMITTRLPDVSDYLEARSENGLELSILRVPTSPNTRQPPMKSRQKFRVPIMYEESSYPSSPGDMAEIGTGQGKALDGSEDESQDLTSVNIVHYEEHRDLIFSDESGDELELSDIEDIIDFTPISPDTDHSPDKQTDQPTATMGSPFSTPYQHRNRSDISLVSTNSELDSLDREIRGVTLEYDDLDLEIMASG